MNVQANEKVEFQVKEPSTVCAHTKGERAGAAQDDEEEKLLGRDTSGPLNPAHTAADDQHTHILLQQGKQVNRTRFRTADHISAATAKLSGDAQVKKKRGVMNAATNSDAWALIRGPSAAGGNEQQSLKESATQEKAREGSQLGGKPAETHLAIGRMSTPLIRLAPLGGKHSCDDMQSMEIR